MRPQKRIKKQTIRDATGHAKTYTYTSGRYRVFCTKVAETIAENSSAYRVRVRCIVTDTLICTSVAFATTESNAVGRDTINVQVIGIKRAYGTLRQACDAIATRLHNVNVKNSELADVYRSMKRNRYRKVEQSDISPEVLAQRKRKQAEVANALVQDQRFSDYRSSVFAKVAAGDIVPLYDADRAAIVEAEMRSESYAERMQEIEAHKSLA